MSPRLAVTSLALLSAVYSSYALPSLQISQLSSREAAATCCAALKSSLPDIVLMPGSTDYVAQQESYYIEQQSELTPACRVAPTTAEQVASIVKTAVAQSCKYAVKGGGHGNNVGESNIGSDGFTIHLGNLNQFNISSDKSMVSTGAGARWVDLYKYLLPYEKVALGGRMPSVGTGGFLLGGGISFFSNTYGWGSTTVKNYQVVLADGSLVNVNEQERSDLYWALKMGSTNYGVVTRFDLDTLPIGKFWGGHISFVGLDTFEDHLKWMKDFVDLLDEDNKGSTGFGVGSVGDGTYNIWSLNSYSDPVAFPSPLFDGLKAIQAAHPGDNQMRISDLVDITGDVEDANPVGVRIRLIPLAVYTPDVQFSLDLHAKGRELFKEIETRSGVNWNYDFQPISKALITASEKRGGNPSGLPAANFFMASGLFIWTNKADDADITAASDALLAWAKKTATERGILNQFVYPDYADHTQDIFSNFGAANAAKLKSIKSKYDSKGNNALWNGGWKL